MWDKTCVICFVFLYFMSVLVGYVCYLAEVTCNEHDLAAGKLQLSKCDIYKVLANGAILFGSQGAEYDVHDIDGIESIHY